MALSFGVVNIFEYQDFKVNCGARFLTLKVKADDDRRYEQIGRP